MWHRISILKPGVIKQHKQFKYFLECHIDGRVLNKEHLYTSQKHFFLHLFTVLFHKDEDETVEQTVKSENLLIFTFPGKARGILLFI